MKDKKPPKTFWNYRVILDKDKNGHPFYSIRGVHYAKHGEKIEGWDAEPANLIFDQGDLITEWLSSLERATEKPVLMVQGDTLTDLGERPAEMFVGRKGTFPNCVTEPGLLDKLNFDRKPEYEVDEIGIPWFKK